MSQNHRPPANGPRPPAKGQGSPKPAAEELPAWTKSIRKLYNNVTQEPLPADFQELLNELGKKIAN